MRSHHPSQSPAIRSLDATEVPKLTRTLRPVSLEAAFAALRAEGTPESHVTPARVAALMGIPATSPLLRPLRAKGLSVTEEKITATVAVLAKAGETVTRSLLAKHTGYTWNELARWFEGAKRRQGRAMASFGVALEISDAPREERLWLKKFCSTLRTADERALAASLVIDLKGDKKLNDLQAAALLNLIMKGPLSITEVAGQLNGGGVRLERVHRALHGRPMQKRSITGVFDAIETKLSAKVAAEQSATGEWTAVANALEAAAQRYAEEHPFAFLCESKRPLSAGEAKLLRRIVNELPLKGENAPEGLRPEQKAAIKLVLDWRQSQERVRLKDLEGPFERARDGVREAFYGNSRYEGAVAKLKRASRKGLVPTELAELCDPKRKLPCISATQCERYKAIIDERPDARPSVIFSPIEKEMALRVITLRRKGLELSPAKLAAEMPHVERTRIYRTMQGSRGRPGLVAKLNQVLKTSEWPRISPLLEERKTEHGIQHAGAIEKFPRHARYMPRAERELVRSALRRLGLEAANERVMTVWRKVGGRARREPASLEIKSSFVETYLDGRVSSWSKFPRSDRSILRLPATTIRCFFYGHEDVIPAQTGAIAVFQRALKERNERAKLLTQAARDPRKVAEVLSAKVTSAEELLATVAHVANGAFLSTPRLTG